MVPTHFTCLDEWQARTALLKVLSNHPVRANHHVKGAGSLQSDWEVYGSPPVTCFFFRWPWEGLGGYSSCPACLIQHCSQRATAIVQRMIGFLKRQQSSCVVLVCQVGCSQRTALRSGETTMCLPLWNPEVSAFPGEAPHWAAVLGRLGSSGGRSA